MRMESIANTIIKYLQSKTVSADQTKNIFGRARFSSYREDMKGVGSFAQETKAIYISDFKLPST